MPRTCAIVINYHGTDKTLKCLESLRGQALDTIHVVDNSASPQEAERLGRALEAFSGDNVAPRVTLSVSEDNLGFGRAVNRAVGGDLAHGPGHDYYLVINNDAVAGPGMVERLVAALEDDSGAALAAPAISTGHGSEGVLRYGRLFGTVSPRKTFMDFPYLSGCCLLFRRGLASSGPVFDEAFFMYGEDALLSCRMQEAGRKILLFPEACVMHEGTGSSSHGGFFYEYHTARCHLLMAFKTWERPYELPLFVLGRVVSLSARALARAVRYQTAAPVLALLACWLPLKVRPSPSRGQGLTDGKGCAA